MQQDISYNIFDLQGDIAGKQYDRALQKIQELNITDNYHAQYTKAHIYYLQGKKTQWKDILDELKKNDPYYPLSIILISKNQKQIIIQLKAQHYRQPKHNTSAYYERVLEVDPKNNYALIEQTLNVASNAYEMQDYLNRCFEIQPHFECFVRNLIKLYFDQDYIDIGGIFVNILLDRNPEDMEGNYLNYLYFTKKQIDDAAQRSLSKYSQISKQDIFPLELRLQQGIKLKKHEISSQIITEVQQKLNTSFIHWILDLHLKNTDSKVIVKMVTKLICTMGQLYKLEDLKQNSYYVSLIVEDNFDTIREFFDNKLLIYEISQQKTISKGTRQKILDLLQAEIAETNSKENFELLLNINNHEVNEIKNFIDLPVVNQWLIQYIENIYDIYSFQNGPQQEILEIYLKPDFKIDNVQSQIYKIIFMIELGYVDQAKQYYKQLNTATPHSSDWVWLTDVSLFERDSIISDVFKDMKMIQNFWLALIRMNKDYCQKAYNKIYRLYQEEKQDIAFIILQLLIAADPNYKQNLNKLHNEFLTKFQFMEAKQLRNSILLHIKGVDLFIDLFDAFKSQIKYTIETHKELDENLCDFDNESQFLYILEQSENSINLDRQVSYQYFVNLKKFNMTLLNKHLIRYNLIKAIHHIFQNEIIEFKAFLAQISPQAQDLIISLSNKLVVRNPNVVGQLLGFIENQETSNFKYLSLLVSLSNINYAESKILLQQLKEKDQQFANKISLMILSDEYQHLDSHVKLYLLDYYIQQLEPSNEILWEQVYEYTKLNYFEKIPETIIKLINSDSKFEANLIKLFERFDINDYQYCPEILYRVINNIKNDLGKHNYILVSYDQFFIKQSIKHFRKIKDQRLQQELIKYLKDNPTIKNQLILSEIYVHLKCPFQAQFYLKGLNLNVLNEQLKQIKEEGNEEYVHILSKAILLQDANNIQALKYLIKYSDDQIKKKYLESQLKTITEAYFTSSLEKASDLADQCKTVEAHQVLGQNLLIDPYHLETLYLIADIHLIDDNNDQAIVYLDKAKQNDFQFVFLMRLWQKSSGLVNGQFYMDLLNKYDPNFYKLVETKVQNMLNFDKDLEIKIDEMQQPDTETFREISQQRQTLENELRQSTPKPRESCCIIQ